MVRYPHSVTVSWQGDPVKNENDGTYTPGATISHTAPCTISQNSEGKRISTEDGKMVEYSCSVIMELQTWNAPFEAGAVLTLEGGATFTTTVKKMHNFQTYSKIWL